MIADGVVQDRSSGLIVYRRQDVPLDAVLEAVAASGETIKSSQKASIRRVGDWVVKESQGQSPIEGLKRAVWPARYRQGWAAAWHLVQHDVDVPRPVAFIERRRLGLVWGNAFISEYLQDSPNVEQFAASIARSNAAAADIHEFLRRLADAVNRLNQAGAYHSDLSGKNILTQGGRKFYFIDLDGVVLNQSYTPACRLKNHVQLYDSFCDLWTDEFLGPFLRHLAPSGCDVESWLGRVREGQAVRRARIEVIWRREGKIR